MADLEFPEWNKGIGKAADDGLNAEYQFWNALLASNSIIAAVFGALTYGRGQWLVFSLVLVSFIASFLIIYNFYARRRWLERTASIFWEPKQTVEQSMNALGLQSLTTLHNIRLREKITLALFVTEAAIILVLLLPKLP